MPRRILRSLALCATLAACAADDLGTDAAAVHDGSPEAIGVVRFLNSPAADARTLDVDAGLDARAARNIAAHVRGPDGALGTADDDPIADLAELDAIPWVGPAAIARLVAYVTAIGGVPTLDVEGVLLTEGEAAAIVAVANGAGLAELDDAAGLDARAARGLVERRPHADVAAVAAVPYVGPAALDRLRVFAATWRPPVAAACEPQLLAGMRACVEAQLADDLALAIDDAAMSCGDAELVGPVFDAVCGGPRPPAFCGLAYEAFVATAVPPCAAALAADLASACRGHDDCGGAPWRCHGRPSDGSSAMGRCVDTTPRPGTGDLCGAPADCAAELVCAGLTLSDEGVCVAGWMEGTYAAAVPVVVPAAAGASVASPVVVSGQASVPMDVVVSVDLDGVDPRRIRLVLADPNGAEAVVWDGATDGAVIPAELVARGEIARDDTINGAWTLTVTTLDAGAVGTLTGWRLYVTSRWD